MPGWMQSKFTRKNFQFSGEHTNRRTNDARNSHPFPPLLIGKNQTENQDTKNVKRKSPSLLFRIALHPLCRGYSTRWNRETRKLRTLEKTLCRIAPCLQILSLSLSFSISVFVQSQVRNALERSRRRCSCPRGNTCTDTTEDSTRGTVFSSRLICA